MTYTLPVKCRNSTIHIIFLPLARHSFSQVGSWRGGGVIKIILSSVMSTDFRYCIMLFKFSAYSSRGTCCLGFRSVRGWSTGSHGVKLLTDLLHNIFKMLSLTTPYQISPGTKTKIFHSLGCRENSGKNTYSQSSVHWWYRFDQTSSTRCHAYLKDNPSSTFTHFLKSSVKNYQTALKAEKSA